MKRSTLIALSVVATALAGYIACDRSPGTDDKRATKARLLPGFSPDKVTRLVLATRGGAAVELVRAKVGAGSEGRWRMVKPASTRADATRVERVLAAVEFLEPLRALSSGKGRGLDPPKQVLTLEQRGKKPVRLELGARDASGRAVYARVGKRVVVLAASFVGLLEGGAARLRERDLVPMAPRAIAAVTLRGAGKDAMSLRRGRHGWMLSLGALRTAAAPAAVGRLVTALGSLRARSFERAGAGAGAGAKPTMVVRVGSGGGKDAVELRVGGACGGAGTGTGTGTGTGAGTGTSTGTSTSTRVRVTRVVVGKPGVEHACVDREDLAPLGGGVVAVAGRLGDRALLRAPLASVASLEIARGKERVVVRRAGTKLLLGDKGGAASPAADAPAVSALLAALSKTNAAPRIAKPEELAAIKRAWAARLTVRREGKGIATLTFGTPQGKRMLVLRAGESAVREVPAAMLARLEPDPLRFRSRVVLRAPRFEVRRIVITRSSGPKREREVVTRDAGGFVVTKPTKVRADRAAVRALLAKLAELRASRFLRLAGAPRADVVVEVFAPRADLAPGAGTGSGTGAAAGSGASKTAAAAGLRLSLATAGAAKPCRGQVSDAPTFELDAATCTVLTRRLGRRAVAPFDAAKLKRLVLERAGAARLSLTRHDGAWHKAADKLASAAAVARLVGALATLRGEVAAYAAPPSSAAGRATLRVSQGDGSARVVRVEPMDAKRVRAIDAAAGVTWTISRRAWSVVLEAFAAAAL